MRTHHNDGAPYGVESLFTNLGTRCMPLVALAHAVIERRGGEGAVKALAEGVIQFEEDLQMASEAAAEGETGHVRRYTLERIGGAR